MLTERNRSEMAKEWSAFLPSLCQDVQLFWLVGYTTQHMGHEPCWCRIDSSKQCMQAAERLTWEDKQDILEDEEGLVIYDGGSYSRGPVRLTPEPGDAAQSRASPAHQVQ